MYCSPSLRGLADEDARGSSAAAGRLGRGGGQAAAGAQADTGPQNVVKCQVQMSNTTDVKYNCYLSVMSYFSPIIQYH